MKKLFKAIKEGDYELVKEILEKKPELISSIAKQPPKSDDGQSLLQVALKYSQIKIAHLLLDLGANVNFIESETCCNEWRTPVIHDAINAAIHSCRFGKQAVYIKANKKKDADEGFAILKRIVELGADVNAKDSYHNSCLDRLCLEASKFLPKINNQTGEFIGNSKIPDSLIEDFSRIFNFMYDSGMETDPCTENDRLSVRSLYENKAVARFLKF